MHILTLAYTLRIRPTMSTLQAFDPDLLSGHTTLQAARGRTLAGAYETTGAFPAALFLSDA